MSAAVRPGLRMQVLADTKEHRVWVHRLLLDAADYNILVEGTEPKLAHVEEFFTARPPGYSKDDAFPLGFFMGQQLTGVGGMLRHWNTASKAMIGLLLFAPQWRGRGLGQAAVNHMEHLAETWPGIETLRVGVIACNQSALTFWRKMDYADTGEIKPKFAPFIDDVIILEKVLPSKR